MKPAGLVVFDLDHTLVQGNMSFAFGKYLYAQGVLSTWAMLKSASAYASHKVFGQSLTWLHRKIFSAFLETFDKRTLLGHVNSFLDKELASLLYAPVLDKLNEALENGQHVALLSSSPDFIVEAVASRMQIQMWIGTCYAVDKQDRLCEISCVVDGHFKAEYLRRLMQRYQVDSSDVTVYSDSILDLPLFEIAGNKIAVNPDQELTRHCVAKAWKII